MFFWINPTCSSRNPCIKKLHRNKVFILHKVSKCHSVNQDMCLCRCGTTLMRGSVLARPWEWRHNLTTASLASCRSSISVTNTSQTQRNASRWVSCCGFSVVDFVFCIPCAVDCGSPVDCLLWIPCGSSVVDLLWIVCCGSPVDHQLWIPCGSSVKPVTE